MFGFEGRSKNTRRRGLRDKAPCNPTWRDLRAKGALASLGIAFLFWGALTLLLLLRQEVVSYRPGQYVPHDIVARVDFEFPDQDQYENLIKAARENAPRVYRQVDGDVWTKIQDNLLTLPDRVRDRNPNELDPPLNTIMDSGSIVELEQDRTGADRRRYEGEVRTFIQNLRTNLTAPNEPLVIIKQNLLDDELTTSRLTGKPRTAILLPSVSPNANPSSAVPTSGQRDVDVSSEVYGTQLPTSVKNTLDTWSHDFEDLVLRSKMSGLTFYLLSQNPTYDLDVQATADQQNKSQSYIRPSDAYIAFHRDEILISGDSTVTDRDWQILKRENQAYHAYFAGNVVKIWQYRLGLALIAGILTMILSAYVARYQPRCVRNHARGIAMAMLLLSMLLLTQLAAIGSNSLYIFGIAPTILAAIILTIAYDQRFAFGMATIHAIIVTAAIGGSLGFFIIIWVGVLTACYLLDDIRTRVKLIEVGGSAALAMIVATAAVGAVQMEPLQFIAHSCLYVGAAGLASGFVVLGILPFIEKAFRITTSMTLLELADASQPLLRRLALEAPGTYNHSLQVATLAEAAAEAIGANSLLCRVGSYYHDIGKINKPDYFVENQMGGENRHLNLSPTLSLRIILAHVKDGVEMAREYNLPTSILPIISQHHGTTLVEYFYHQAVTQGDQQADPGPRLSDTEFRYPGPKPKSKEAAIVMLCDIVESACRSLSEPTASRIESKVHELAKKRLEDSQFDECDLTMRDFENIERALAKTLLGIYHGRITYPTEVAPARSVSSGQATKSA